MSCCCPHSQSAGRLFSKVAKRYRKRFNKKGFEPSQQNLMQGLQQAGYQQASVLEIGSGVGYLHQTMLVQGAKNAVGIELSPQMLEEAQDWAKEKGLAEQVEYHEGDFINLAKKFNQMDVTVLDKVVCCYPDAEGMVKTSLSKTQRVYALTYPRYRWFIRLVSLLGSQFLKLTGTDFRPYIHNPENIEKWISEAGFIKVFDKHTFIWMSQVYIKAG